MSDLLLEAKGIHTYYGNSHILRGVNVRIRRGETLGLLGRNGMGKTTLIRTLLGLVPSRRGRVFVKNADTTYARPDEIARAGIAYVPEGRGIFPNLSVRENLLMAARASCEGRLDWSLDRVLQRFPRLAQRLDHGGAQLSGGEQQMLTIGRALLTNPDLLVLDEATEGLAPMIARDIWNIVKEIRESGVAIVIVDKNHAAITSIADRSMILVKGEVVFEGESGLLKDGDLIQRHLGI